MIFILLKKSLKKLVISTEKINKGFSASNARAAMFEAEAEAEAEAKKLKHQLESLQNTRPRKRVHVDPNQRFADIDNIMSAVGEPAGGEGRGEGENESNTARLTSNNTAATTFETLCNSWQLPM